MYLIEIHVIKYNLLVGTAPTYFMLWHTRSENCQFYFSARLYP